MYHFLVIDFRKKNPTLLKLIMCVEYYFYRNCNLLFFNQVKNKITTPTSWLHLFKGDLGIPFITANGLQKFSPIIL